MQKPQTTTNPNRFYTFWVYVYKELELELNCSEHGEVDFRVSSLCITNTWHTYVTQLTTFNGVHGTTIL